jgi:acetyl-CoA carboxylase carboxyltransferase component
LDAAGSQKLTRLLKFCDVMNLPIVQFVDVRKLFTYIYTSI